MGVAVALAADPQHPADRQQALCWNSLAGPSQTPLCSPSGLLRMSYWKAERAALAACGTFTWTLCELLLAHLHSRRPTTHFLGVLTKPGPCRHHACREGSASIAPRAWLYKGVP